LREKYWYSYNAFYFPKETFASVLRYGLLSRGIRIYDVVTTNIYISPPIIRISVTQ